MENVREYMELNGIISFSVQYGLKLLEFGEEDILDENFYFPYQMILLKGYGVPQGAFELNGIQLRLKSESEVVLDCEAKVNDDGSLCITKNHTKPFSERGILYIRTVNGWVDIMDTEGISEIRESYEDYRTQRGALWKIMWNYCSSYGVSKTEFRQCFGRHISYEGMKCFVNALLIIEESNCPKAILQEALTKETSETLCAFLKWHDINLTEDFKINRFAIKTYLKHGKTIS